MFFQFLAISGCLVETLPECSHFSAISGCWDPSRTFQLFSRLRMPCWEPSGNVRIVRPSLDVETLPERSNYPAFSGCPVENLRERPIIVRFRLHKCKPSGRSYCCRARLCVHLLSLSIESTVEFPAAQHLWVICLNKLTWRINHNNAAVLSRRLSFFAEAGAFGVFFPLHLFACQKRSLFFFPSLFPSSDTLMRGACSARRCE